MAAASPRSPPPPPWLPRGFVGLPKVDVHAHLGGSARCATVAELLASHAGCSTADAESMAAASVIPRQADGVPLEPDGYDGFGIVGRAHGGSPTLLGRIAWEFLEDCEADGVAYAEIRTGGTSLRKLEAVVAAMERYAVSRPGQRYGDGEDGGGGGGGSGSGGGSGGGGVSSVDGGSDAATAADVPARDAAPAASEAGSGTVARPEPRLPMCRLIVSIKRDASADKAWSTVRNAVSLNKAGRPVVAIDFCGGEPEEHPFTPAIAEAVAFARDAGLAFVPHLGESRLEAAEDHAALLNAAPVRVGHGVFLGADAMRRVQESGVYIEACLASNLNTMRRDGALPACTARAETGAGGDGGARAAAERGIVEAARLHPIVKWHASEHVRVVLCSDNLGLLQVPMSECYRVAATAVSPDGATASEIGAVAWKMAWEAVDCVLADNTVKERLRDMLRAHEWATSS